MLWIKLTNSHTKLWAGPDPMWAPADGDAVRAFSTHATHTVMDPELFRHYNFM